MARIERFQEQIDAAEARFNQRFAPRRKRLLAIRDLSKTRKLSDVDEPARILQRLMSLGLSESAASAANETWRPRMPPEATPNDATVLERILGDRDLLRGSFLTSGAHRSRATGRIVTRSSGFGFGTGFLISKRLLMTNNHVFRSASDAAASAIEFDYVEGPDGRVGAVTRFLFEPATLFVTSRELDYSLVAVQARNDDGAILEQRGWSPLIRQSGKVLVSEPVNIVQHPGGEPQQVALRANNVLDLDGHFIHYKADTERGSSGSPVYNDQWDLAALHHAGVPARDDQDRILLVDGRVWDGSDRTAGQIWWVANEGVRISHIAADLDRRMPSLDHGKQELLAGGFQHEPNGGEGPDDESSGESAIARVDEDGTLSWTVPLHLRMNLGDHVPRLAVGATPPDATSLPPTDLDAEAALVEQRRAEFEGRAYYDEAADFAAYEAYFADFPTTALSPTRWFTYFSNKARETHEHRFSYKRARLDFLYPWIDLHEDDGQRQLRNVYSGEVLDFHDVVVEDLQVERVLEEARMELLSEGVLDPDELRERLAELEAQAKFNCEHIVCQSWFHERQPMKADLHHLFSCDPGCNSFRNNIPYFDFSEEEEKVRERCGRREDGKGFEPAAGKGPAARATLYFLLRYPGEIGDEASELQRERLDVLLDWNDADPVGLYELHRNAAVHEFQGNRNPLIDHPELARHIDFKRGFSRP